MDKLKELYRKNKSIILYLFFGVCTTAVNFIMFYLLDFVHLGTEKVDLIIDNTVSWVASVIFAYITNKKWVFESKASNKKDLIKEIGSFFSCRIATYIMDTVIIYVCVTVCGMNKWIIKIISNVLVIILNYVGSKLIVFKKQNND